MKSQVYILQELDEWISLRCAAGVTGSLTHTHREGETAEVGGVRDTADFMTVPPLQWEPPGDPTGLFG